MCKTIYTFGDGFATGHLWPEWPQLLQALLPDYTIVNTAAVGAGAEWLVHRCVQQLPNLANCNVVFQWPIAGRFDKLIEDDVWHTIVKNDPVYFFNLHIAGNETWWPSSASTANEVIEYHSKFVQPQQHLTRINDYMILLENTLSNINCDYVFTSTNDQHQFSLGADFKDTRGAEIQPSPVVHLNWLVEIILPQLQIVPDSDRLLQLHQLIYQFRSYVILQHT